MIAVLFCMEFMWCLEWVLCPIVHRPGLEVHERDGVAFISERAAEVASGASAPVDLLFVDVFDGDDQVPLAFKEPGEHFMTALLLPSLEASSSLVLSAKETSSPC